MEYCTTRLVPSLNIWAVHICPFLRVKCKPAWTGGGGGGGGGFNGYYLCTCACLTSSCKIISRMELAEFDEAASCRL